jgi:hypothetical protein
VFNFLSNNMSEQQVTGFEASQRERDRIHELHSGEMQLFLAGFMAGRPKDANATPHVVEREMRDVWKYSGARINLVEKIGKAGVEEIEKIEREYLEKSMADSALNTNGMGGLFYHQAWKEAGKPGEWAKFFVSHQPDLNKVEDFLLDTNVSATDDGQFLFEHLEDQNERTRRARLPEVSALTRYNRMQAAEANGNPNRGMIPGGEDEAAYLVAVETVDDPEPVWTAMQSSKK